MKKVLVLFLFLAGMTAYAGNDSTGIIPMPDKVEVVKGQPFRIQDGMRISYAPAFGAQAEYLRQLLETSTGFEFKMNEGSSKRGIVLIHDASAVSEAEGYILEVSGKNVRITAHDASGAFYGIQTMLQLLPAEVYSKYQHKGIDWEIAPVRIEDAPERPWRGMMLDVARYFYDMEFVKKYVDMMAMYKMNILQFHFIDDSGWRLEIKKYPRLTEVGAWAKTGTHPLGGYYTQEEIKDLVEYAAVRGVEIIPEIEFPAHVLSAVAAYPWLCCSGLQHEVPDRHFISRDLLCVGKESTYKFLNDVMDEVVELFPSKYINIGGDEAVYTQWEKCPLCQKVREEQGLEKTSDLQGYLTNKVGAMLKEKGKTVVGWEEIIMRGKVDVPVVALMWHKADSLIAKNAGHKAVLIPSTHAYFDFPESSTPGEVKGATWMPPISVEKVYSMPVNDYSEKSTVIGVEGCFWSDQFIHGKQLQEIVYLNENRSENYCDYFTFPRMIALSEVAWGREADRDYNGFRKRLASHFVKLENKECNYRVPEPIVESLEKADGQYVFTLSSPVEGREIRYTTDGTYPHRHSPLYTGPVTVKDKYDFRAITLASNRHFSLPLYYSRDFSEFAEYGEYVGEWTTTDGSSNLRFECSGKITSNGHYELTLVRETGNGALDFEGIKVFKLNELIADKTDIVKSASGDKVTLSFDIAGFEAGTRYFVEVCVKGTADIGGIAFLK